MKRALWMVLLISLTASHARADNWTVRIASWNVLNLGDRKAGINPVANRNLLLNQYAQIISQYDIVFLEEILNGGQSVTQAIANQPALANYNCQTISVLSGRIGRQERYAMCFTNAHQPLGAQLAVNNTFDYMAQGGPYTAVDGTFQPAQNVWMRPPLFVTFTYTPAPGMGAPYTFSVYVSHTKPSFGGQARPPGTPPNAPANSSVFYELRAMENVNNLRPGIANYAVIGDLNADCASYPVMYRGQNFPAPYAWYINYGQRTNTAPNSSCAYDRIILNAGMQAVYLNHGIYALGIPAPVLNGERLSDHYLVWVQIGRTTPPPSIAAAAMFIASVASQIPLPPAKRQRRFTNQTSGGSPININGSGIMLPTGVTTPKLYVIPYTSSNFFEGNQTIPLQDVRGSPTPVTVNQSGNFTANVAWNNPTNGAYSLVLDANGDGKYDRYSGDIATYDNEIDFIVNDGTGHSPLMSLDDNANAREIFNSNSAMHVYALARGLTPGASVDVYVVSSALLPANFPGWAAARQQGNLNLANVSIPVNRTEGPILVPSLTNSDKVQTLTVDPTGSLFFSVWTGPSQLLNAQVWTATPPTPDYKPEYDNQDGDEDPCESAWQSSDANFQAVCNVGHSFGDYYGNQFNIVIDVNRSGLFGDGDLVDSHDLGDMSTFFNGGGTVLGPPANGNPAVGEYKEYLNAKLSLNPPLTNDNVYDDKTKLASTQYLCTPTLSRSQFQTIVTPGSQIGFKVLNQADYSTYRSLSSGAYSFIDATVNQLNVAPDSQVCIVGNNVDLGDTTVNSNSTLTIQASNTVTLHGNVTTQTNTTACVVAGAGMTIAAAGAVTAITAPPSAPISLLVSGAGFVVSQVAGAFCAGL